MTSAPLPDVLVLSHLRWDHVFQRPHHLLTRCAKEARTFFIEEPVFRGTRVAMEVMRAAKDLWVCTPVLPEAATNESTLQRDLLDQLITDHQVERFVLWYFTPMAVSFTRHLRPAAIVYDCMDELSAFADAPPDLVDREHELIDSVDVFFTGGRSLYEARRERHSNVHLFPSSVDVDHFAKARHPQDDPDDQAGLARPRLGYFGVIDERIDLDLLAGVADARPGWNIVMLGPVAKIDQSALPQRDNIAYLGPKPYSELPRYAAGWDVAIMPFAHNSATKFISPTKTPEYLAAGRPVVSTSIRDVVRPYGEQNLARIADTVDEFVQATEEALADDPSALLAAADELLATQSWDMTWAAMRTLIDEAIARNEPTPLDDHVSRIHTNGQMNGQTNGKPRAVLRVVDPGPPSEAFDYLVVGAGFAGSVIAERLASQADKRVLVVDKRPHIAGNAYDHYNEHGILVHRYGPHIFHTNSEHVFDYLSDFTTWRPYQHRVLASVDGRLVAIPINLDTINDLYGTHLTAHEAEAFLESLAEPVAKVCTSEDVVVSRVGRTLYEKFFRGYTRKQWGVDPSELDATVTSRVPVRTNRDDRYFTDKYQAMPAHGYTKMFERILDHPNIKVMLNTDFKEVRSFVRFNELVFTGPIDEYFDYRLGKLPYRSLEFRFETHDVERFQPAPVVNYPNENPYTRVTEFKHLTGQEHRKTTLVYEYPRAEGDPYYPVPRAENAELYRKYKALGEQTPGVHFVGRLGTYKYYNMDQVVAQALAVFSRLNARPTSRETADEPPTRSVSSTVGGRGVHPQQGWQPAN